MRELRLCLAMLAGVFPGISAFSQSVSANGALNNLITERVYNLDQPNLKGSIDTNRATSTPFITASAASLEFDYTYTRNWFQVTTPGGGYTAPETISKINGYGITPSLFLEIRSNLLVTAGFEYMYQKISVNDGTSQTLDDYTPFICADEELLHFLPRLDTTRNSLFLGGNFSYTRAVSSGSSSVTLGPGGYTIPVNAAGITYNNYSFGPSLVYIRSLADWSDGTPGRVALTLSPAYSYNYNQSSFNLERTGVVTVLGRVDYGLTRNLYLNASGTWVHRNYIGLTADNDFALFGCGLAAKLVNRSNHLILARLMYDYQAFVRHAEAHEVSAQVEFHF